MSSSSIDRAFELLREIETEFDKGPDSIAPNVMVDEPFKVGKAAASDYPLGADVAQFDALMRSAEPQDIPMAWRIVFQTWGGVALGAVVTGFASLIF